MIRWQPQSLRARLRRVDPTDAAILALALALGLTALAAILGLGARFIP